MQMSWPKKRGTSLLLAVPQKSKRVTSKSQRLISGGKTIPKRPTRALLDRGSLTEDRPGLFVPCWFMLNILGIWDPLKQASPDFKAPFRYNGNRIYRGQP